MSLLDEARTKSVRIPPVCTVRTALADHPKKADEIAEVIRDRSISHAAAGTVFRTHGIAIDDFSISRHRQNKCRGCEMAGLTW